MSNLNLLVNPQTCQALEINRALLKYIRVFIKGKTLRGQWPQELILEVLDDGVIVIWSHSLWYTGPATHRWGPIVPTARTTVTKMAKRTGHTNLSCGTVWLGNPIRTWYLLGAPLLLDSHGSLAPSMYNPIVRHEASFDILVHA